MIIDGFNKLTLLDYPNNIACIIFTRGCNFKCSYCQNSSLIPNREVEGRVSEEEVIKYLKSRINILDGIVISGGEPTLQLGLISFIKKVKELGLKVKLDTNGTNPKVIKYLIDHNLVDYIAMDIKNDLDNYNIVNKCKSNINKIKESIELLKNSDKEVEFRTTVMKEYHTLDNIKKILNLIGNKNYYIQNFRLSDDVIDKSLTGFSDLELLEIKDKLKEYNNVFLKDIINKKEENLCTR